MVMDNDLISFLKNCYSIGGNCIYITDLENVKGFVSSEFKQFNQPMSKELLQVILDISIEGNEEFSCIINEKDKIIPVFENRSLNTDWKAQIIVPIWYDDRIRGTLIFTNFHKTFHEQHLEFAKLTQAFVQKIILKQINQNYKEENQ